MGNSIDLNDYIDTGNFAEQPFVIPKADLGISYCEVNENFKAYKINEHQHMPEMGKILRDIDNNTYNINFVPHLLPVNRGILSTMYLKLSEGLREEDIISLYKRFYEKEWFYDDFA